MGGDKNKVGGMRIKDFLAAGISVVSIEYRFISDANKEDVKTALEYLQAVLKAQKIADKK